MIEAVRTLRSARCLSPWASFLLHLNSERATYLGWTRRQGAEHRARNVGRSGRSQGGAPSVCRPHSALEESHGRPPARGLCRPRRLLLVCAGSLVVPGHGSVKGHRDAGHDGLRGPPPSQVRRHIRRNGLRRCPAALSSTGRHRMPLRPGGPSPSGPLPALQRRSRWGIWSLQARN